MTIKPKKKVTAKSIDQKYYGDEPLIPGEEITVDFADSFFVEFADSFFETFTGTDEELQEVLNSLVEMIKDGTLFAESEPFSEEDLTDEEAEALMSSFNRKRTLH
jgi:hypothetical protein